jgi:hypothetical protein
MQALGMKFQVPVGHRKTWAFPRRKKIQSYSVLRVLFTLHSVAVQFGSNACSVKSELQSIWNSLLETSMSRSGIFNSSGFPQIKKNYLVNQAQDRE